MNHNNKDSCSSSESGEIESPTSTTISNEELYSIWFYNKANSEEQQNDLIMIIGSKGMGKTYLIDNTLIPLYHEFNPSDRIIVIEGTNNPDIYQHDYIIRPDLFELDIEEAPDPSQFADSLIIFDDTDNIMDAKINKYMNSFMKSIIQTGRNHRITIVVTTHVGAKGKDTTLILSNADALVISPRRMSSNTRYLLKNHIGLSKEEIETIQYNYSHNRYFLLRISQPSYLFTPSEGKFDYL